MEDEEEEKVHHYVWHPASEEDYYHTRDGAKMANEQKRHEYIHEEPSTATPAPVKKVEPFKSKTDYKAAAANSVEEGIAARAQKDKNVTKEETSDEAKDAKVEEKVPKSSDNVTKKAESKIADPIVEPVVEEPKKEEKGELKYTYHTSGGAATTFEFRDVNKYPVE